MTDDKDDETVPPGYRILGEQGARYGVLEHPVVRVVSPSTDVGWTKAEAAGHCRVHAEVLGPDRPSPDLSRLASLLLDTACRQANQALHCNDAPVALDHVNAAGAALAAYYETPEGVALKASHLLSTMDPAVAVADLCRVLGYPEDLSAWEAVDGAVARLKVYREAAAALSTGMNLPLHVDIDEAVRIALGRLGAS